MQFKYIDCPTSTIEIKNHCGMVTVGNYLFINQNSKLTVWDITQPTDIKQVNEYPFPRFRTNMQLHGNLLYVWGKWLTEKEHHIHVLDISDPLNIQELQDITSPTKLRALHVFNNRLFGGLEGKIIELVDGTEKELFSFTNRHGYTNVILDLLAHENWLVSSGGRDGIHIFNLNTNGSITQVKHIPSEFAMPFGLSWDVPGQSFLVIGSNIEDVLKFDMSQPEKTKRVKAAKTTAALSKQYIQHHNMLWVFGITPLTYKPVISEVDISNNIPIIIQHHEIKRNGNKNNKPDSAYGIIPTGNYLLVSSHNHPLSVLEIQP